MDDLAKRETPLRSRPQTTFRRETTIPRANTDLPGLEVNAQIHRPDMSGAEELSRVLGLANKVGQNIVRDVKESQDNQATADALLDYSKGQQNPELFAKSRAYRDAWQLQGAKKLAIDVSDEVTRKWNTALNDPDHPATMEELDKLFEDTVRGHLVDEHEQPLNFITPQAKMTLGTALMKLKTELVPQAARAIKLQQDDRLLATTFHNMIFERATGGEIGAPPAPHSQEPAAQAEPVIEDPTGVPLSSAVQRPVQHGAGFNVAGFMAALPPSVDKGEAKTWLIQSLIAEAASTRDTSILNGLEDVARKDGTPLFTPEERLTIADNRRTLTKRFTHEADEAESKLHEDNAEAVLQAFIEGNPPSKSWLAEKGREGLLDERFVYSMVNHVEEQARQDAREARMEARQEQAEADNDTDAMVYAIEAERRAGILTGSSYQEDLQRFHSGELGTGKKAAARLLRLQAATKAGQKMTEESPEFAYYSGQLADNFKPVRDTGRLMLLRPQAKLDKATYQGMVSFYQEKVHSGEKPGDAYREAVQKYAPKPPQGRAAAEAELPSVRAQIEALRRKRAGLP